MCPPTLRPVHYWRRNADSCTCAVVRPAGGHSAPRHKAVPRRGSVMLNPFARRGVLVASLVSLAVGGLAVPAAAGPTQSTGTTVKTSGSGCSATGSGPHAASASGTDQTATFSHQPQQQLAAATA